MADSAATRARRSRKHRGGDHTDCLPSRCRDAGNVTVPVTKNVTAPEPAPQPAPPTPVDDSPDGLQARGRRLWRDLSEVYRPLGPAQRVLLEEACRIADRLERLDRYLTGHAEEWLTLQESLPGSPRLFIIVDRALAESRQQSTALKQLLTELRQSAGAGARRGRPTAPAAEKGVAGVADLTGRIAERRAASTD